MCGKLEKIQLNIRHYRCKKRKKRLLGLPDLQLYFLTCWLVWLKEWVLLRNKRLILEGHNLRFG